MGKIPTEVYAYICQELLILLPMLAGIYLLKVNNWNTRTRCEICSKLTIKIPERRQLGMLLVICLFCVNNSSNFLQKFFFPHSVQMKRFSTTDANFFPSVTLRRDKVSVSNNMMGFLHTKFSQNLGNTGLLHNFSQKNKKKRIKKNVSLELLVDTTTKLIFKHALKFK